MRSRKAFGDYNPDSTKCVSSIPVALLQDLSMERRKAKTVLIAIPIDIGTELYQGSQSVSVACNRWFTPNVPIIYGHGVLWPKMPPLARSINSRPANNPVIS